jgi:hypothetical protein
MIVIMGCTSQRLDHPYLLNDASCYVILELPVLNYDRRLSRALWIMTCRDRYVYHKVYSASCMGDPDSEKNGPLSEENGPLPR